MSIIYQILIGIMALGIILALLNLMILELLDMGYKFIYRLWQNIYYIGYVIININICDYISDIWDQIKGG